jgi:hypothetical protein
MNDCPNITALLGDLPKKHILRLMRPLEQCAYFLHYVETLFGEHIASINALNLSEEKRTRIVSKLLDPRAFYSILAEVEALVHFCGQGLSPVPEPMYPNAGPDFQVTLEGVTAFVEVCSLATDDADRDFNLISGYIHGKMEKVPSRYSVSFDLSETIAPYSPLLKRACNAVRRFIGELQETRAEEGTLYTSSDGGINSFIGGDFVLEESDYGDCEKLQMQERLHSCPVRVHFKLMDVQPGNHSMTTCGGAWLGGRERIRRVLSDKLDQLPRGQRNVIVVDWSHLSGAGEHDFLDALYGTSHLAYELGNRNVREYRGEDGFFSLNRRVQAVVALNRSIAGELKARWTVFPTNNEAADDRMNPDQLRLFGEIQPDLERLAL